MRHKEAACLMQTMEPFGVDRDSVHDVEGLGFGYRQIEEIDIVQCAVADMQERGDVAAQVRERVQLEAPPIARAKRGPQKHRQIQVDGAGIQRIDRVF